MAQSTLWPEFGKWEGAENVPDKAYFEEARKGQNDSKMEVESSAHKLDVDSTHGNNEAQLVPSNNGLTAARPENEHQEHGVELSTQTEFLVLENAGQRATSGDNSKRAVKKNVGYDRSVGQSTLHPYQQARIGNKGRGASSPSCERKGGSYANGNGLVSLTIRRARSRSVTSSNESNDASVPKFGDWDEGNPSSADRYSQIFEMVREEKLSGGKVPTSWTETSSSNSNAQKNHTNAIYQICCCFPWSRKL